MAPQSLATAPQLKAPSSKKPSGLPFVDFKVQADDDDFGRCCRMLEIGEDRHIVTVRTKLGYVSIGQAPFKTAKLGIEWAQNRYRLYGELEIQH